MVYEAMLGLTFYLQFLYLIGTYYCRIRDVRTNEYSNFGSSVIQLKTKNDSDGPFHELKLISIEQKSEIIDFLEKNTFNSELKKLSLKRNASALQEVNSDKELDKPKIGKNN